VYENCPLPTPEDRLFFLLTYLKTSALQVVHGRLFGMDQSKVKQWMRVLLPALLAALRTLGDAPARSLTALAQRFGVSEADAATVIIPLAEEEPTPGVAVPAAAPVSPLLPMMVQSSAPSGLRRCSTDGLLERQEKRPHGEKCPTGEYPPHNPLAERHLRWLHP
jgi:hypothetical protein